MKRRTCENRYLADAPKGLRIYGQSTIFGRSTIQKKQLHLLTNALKLQARLGIDHHCYFNQEIKTP